MKTTLLNKRSMLAAGLVAAAIVTGGATWKADALAPDTGDQYSNLPATLTLTGVCRDFKWRNTTGGHNDFEWQPTAGYGHYAGSVKDTLDSDGKPQFKSQGYKVSTQATDAAGRNRMPVSKEYIDSKSGDKPGSVATTTGGSLSNESNFRSWFRDLPGVNMSKPIPLTLVRQSGTNLYSFSDKVDPAYTAKGGFFPINNDLLGNPSGQTKNFGFTYELDTNFVYKQGSGQVFTFTGDDDVWVFIDGKLVVDIGGVHSAVSQTIELDRLNWLQDGKKYNFKLFFAERHTTQSNVRIDTTINLMNAELPVTSGLYD